MLSRGVHPVKLNTFDMLRVWAAITGLLLAAGWCAGLCFGFATSETLPMLIAGICGFELYHYAQDIVLRRRSDANG